MKKVFKIIGITLLVIILLLIAIPFVFQGKIKDIVKNTINNNVNANVEFSDINLSFIRSFPQAQVDVSDLESFISDTWDKYNLTPGEVSQYVDLAGERVNLYQIKQYQQDLQEQLDDDMHSEDGKLRYTLIDAIDKQIQNRDKCMNRIQKLQDSLEGSRTKRLEKEGGDQVNILTLCEDLAKEKKRMRLTKMLEKERNKVVKVVNEIEDMTDYTARLYGASRGELLN